MTRTRPRPPLPRRTRSFRVLVADDDERSLDSLVALLDLEGFATEAAHCGLEALARLGLDAVDTSRASGERNEAATNPQGFDTRVDFLVLDYNMPDVTGIEVLRRVSIGFGTPLPAILVSGEANRELRRLWAEVGGVSLLPKPVVPVDFRNEVQGLIRRFLGGDQD